MPVKNAPIEPPRACTPNVSSASSYPNQPLTLKQKNHGMSAAKTPMIMAPLGVTKPHAGVITTNPATAPEQNPRTLGLPRTNHSSIGQTKEAPAVASVVVVKALAAMPSAATALPALKPYQPTQSMPVPIMQSTMLCGVKCSLPQPRRLPRIKQRIRADQPEVICTTVPPAKSMALILASGLETPFIKPSMPQIMCACGK